MAQRNAILTGLALFLLVVGVGFAGGYYFHAKKKDAPSPAEQAFAKTEPPPPNHTTYDVSPPSRGAVLRTFPVDIKPGENFVTVTLDALKAADVKTGQQILLYDANDSLLDMFGTVGTITPHEGSIISVELLLNGNGDAASATIVKGDIILARQSDAQRLPRSALVRDRETGEPYLWEVNKSEEDSTFKAYYKRTDLLMETKDFVVISTPASKSNVYVLKADDALRDGQAINTREELYSAPPLTEDQIVAANIETRYPTPPGPDPYTGPDFPSMCQINSKGEPLTGAMSKPSVPIDP